MKIKTILLILSVTLFLTACGTQSENATAATQSQTTVAASTTTESTSETADISVLDDVEVDEGLFNVELTVPPDFVGDSTQADLDEICKEYGFKSITLNADGSATYIMTKKQHKQLLEDIRDQINEGLDDLVNSGDYPNFTDIKANDNFTEFTVTTKSSELDITESLSVLGLYIYGGMYSVFAGEEVDNISVTFINADTGEVISTSNSADLSE